MLLDLTDDEAVWLDSIESKHRYYVRKSRSAGLIWQYGDDDTVLGALADLTLRMEREKGLPSRGMSSVGLTRLRTLLPGVPRVLVGYLDGEAVTACLVLRRGSGGFLCNSCNCGAWSRRKRGLCNAC